MSARPIESSPFADNNSTVTDPQTYLSDLEAQVQLYVEEWMLNQDPDLYPEFNLSGIDITDALQFEAVVRGYVYGNAVWDLTKSTSEDDQKLWKAVQKQLQPTTLHIEDEVATKQIDSGRRLLLKGMAGAGALVALGMTNLIQNNAKAQYEDRTDTLSQDNHAEVPVESYNTEEHEQVHNPDYISKVDMYSAMMVSSLFATTLGTQTAAGLVEDGKISKKMLKTLFGTDEQSKAELSGWTASTMFSAWSARIMALKVDSETNKDENEKIASTHAYEHELAELPNIAVALGLVAASEITSNLYYESRSEFQKKALDALSAFSKDQPFRVNSHEVTKADFEAFLAVNSEDVESRYRDVTDSHELMRLAQEDVKSFLDAQKAELSLDKVESNIDSITTEELDGQITSLDQNLADDILLNSYLSTFTAPMSLTFTTASLVNKRLKPIALNFTKKHYLERIKQAKVDKESITPDMLQQFWKQANDQTLGEMNGKMGLVNLSVTTAANIAGVALFGDPPNIFFIKDHGWDEWLQNSKEGFAYGMMYSTVAHNAYIGKHLGRAVQYTEANKKSITGALQILGNTGYHLGLEKLRQGLVKVDPTGKIAAQWGPKDYKRGHLSFDYQSFFDDIGNKAKEMVYGDFMSQKYKELGDFISKYYESATTLSEDEAAITNMVKEMLQDMGIPETDSESVDTTNPFQKLVEQATDSIGEGIQQEIITELNTSMQAIIIRLDAITADDIEQRGIETLANEISTDSFFITFPDTVQENLRSLVTQQLESKVSHIDHEKHGHAHALSHSARDVRNALMTQLWAVGSLQTIAKKSLGLDQPGKIPPEKAKRYATTVLAIIAGTSAVADNVAAMLFGIDVLEKIGEKSLGDEYDEQSNFAKKLRKYAFMMSVFAGSLSKIGNGPNMSIEKIAEVFRDNERNIMEVKGMASLLGPSFANGWSGLAVGGLLTGASADLWGEIDRQ